MNLSLQFSLFLIVVFSFNYICASEDIPTLTFQKMHGLSDHLSKEAAIQHLERQLNTYHKNVIRIRGFIYQKGAEWILASEPNVKNCCIGKNIKISQQIVMDEIFDKNNSEVAVTVEGLFMITPKWDLDGNLTQLYSLKNVKIIPNKVFNSYFLLAGLSIGGIILIWRVNEKNKIIYETK